MHAIRYYCLQLVTQQFALWVAFGAVIGIHGRGGVWGHQVCASMLMELVAWMRLAADGNTPPNSRIKIHGWNLLFKYVPASLTILVT